VHEAIRSLREVRDSVREVRGSVRAALEPRSRSFDAPASS
jgi:hypothetical protein